VPPLGLAARCASAAWVPSLHARAPALSVSSSFRGGSPSRQVPAALAGASPLPSLPPGLGRGLQISVPPLGLVTRRSRRIRVFPVVPLGLARGQRCSASPVSDRPPPASAGGSCSRCAPRLDRGLHRSAFPAPDPPPPSAGALARALPRGFRPGLHLCASPGFANSHSYPARIPSASTESSPVLLRPPARRGASLTEAKASIRHNSSGHSLPPPHRATPYNRPRRRPFGHDRPGRKPVTRIRFHEINHLQRIPCPAVRDCWCGDKNLWPESPRCGPDSLE
jgi:hypothetical protein